MVCCVCGREIKEVMYSRPICSPECFHKKYWMDIIEEKDCHVIINGVCYFVAPEHAPSPRGHSGRKFVLKSLRDDSLTETTNLWYQGEIPEEFRGDLPDTHVFVHDA